MGGEETGRRCIRGIHTRARKAHARRPPRPTNDRPAVSKPRPTNDARARRPCVVLLPFLLALRHTAPCVAHACPEDSKISYRPCCHVDPFQEGTPIPPTPPFSSSHPPRIHSHSHTLTLILAAHSRSTFPQHILIAHLTHNIHIHIRTRTHIAHTHTTHAHNTRTQHTHTEHTHTHTHTRTPAHTHTRKAAAALTLNPLALCSDTQRVRNVSTGALSRLCSLLGPGEDSRKPKRSRARTTFALMIEARVLARVATGGARGLIPHQTRALDGARKESH